MSEVGAAQVAITPNDSFWRFQYRRLATGLCWSVFGLGGLFLTLTWFHWLNWTVNDKELRVQRARSTISASFRLFFRFCKLMGVMNYDTASIEQLRSVKSSIIIANHPTILDYVFLASQLPQLDCLVKAKLRENFFLKGVVKAADYMLNDESAALVEECKKRLADGHNILIFPEGTRTVPGQPLKLQRGVAHIALRCRCDIEVAHIYSSDRWLDKSSQWYEIPRSKPTITLRRGTTIKTADFIGPKEDTYSLAARRLTRYMTEVLQTPLTALNQSIQ